MTTAVRVGNDPAGLAPIALALAEESVRTHHEDALVEKSLSSVESRLRQSSLEGGRRALLTAATKAVAGAAISAGFQLAAAGAQFASASATTQAACLAGGDQAGARLAEAAAKTWDAVASLDVAFSKAGDILGATGQYDQARKVLYDKSAESLQQAVQDAERARTAARDAAASELAAMKDLVEQHRDSVRAAQRA